MFADFHGVNTPTIADFTLPAKVTASRVGKGCAGAHCYMISYQPGTIVAKNIKSIDNSKTGSDVF